jgi:hypothetical protein
VGRQPLCVLDAGSFCSTQYDTLRLSRAVGPGLMAGITATYFFLPHLGVHAQLGYEGFPLDDSCATVHVEPDPEQRSTQLCDDIDRSTLSGGALHVAAGVVLRAAARGAVSPYLRAGVGIVNRPQSAVRVVGSYVAGGTIVARDVIADPSPHGTSISGTVALGLTAPLSPGYQLRLELRDAVSGIERAAGPADALAHAPTAIRTFNSLALTVGLDIVLEQKRGRRY